MSQRTREQIEDEIWINQGIISDLKKELIDLDREEGR